MEHSSIIDNYLEKPYWVIDILPKQVPANGQGQYFKIEEYFLKEPQFGMICKKFSSILIKLNCYYDISVCNTLNKWSDNPTHFIGSEQYSLRPQSLQNLPKSGCSTA